jgi:hypothetical protein
MKPVGATSNGIKVAARGLLGRGLQKLMGICAIGMLAYAACSSIPARVRLHSTGGAFLVVSARPYAQDIQLRSFVEERKRLTYARRNSPYVQKLQGVISLPREDIFLITASEQPSVITGAETIGKVFADLDQVERASDQRQNFIVAFLALILGAILARALLPNYRYLLLAASMMSFWRYSHTCTTCEPTLIFGVDAALVGTFSFAAAALANWSQSRQGTLIAVTLASAACIWQAFQLMMGAQACIPCAAILAINGLIIGSGCGELAQASAHSGKELRSRLTLRFALVTTALFLMVSVHGSHTALQSGTPSTSLKKRPSYVGKKLHEVATALPARTTKALYMFGSPHCDPCVQAKQALSRMVDIEVVTVELVDDGQDPEWQGLHLPSSAVEMPSTPTFLLVSSTGDIEKEFFGWSGDSLWREAFLDLFQARRPGQAAGRVKV